MKVWGFNCYGVCIKLIALDKIEEWIQNNRAADYFFMPGTL